MDARAAIVFLASLLLAVSCRDSLDSHYDPEPSSAPAPASAALSPPIDIGAVIRQVHFAFRPAKQGFSGGHDSYSVDASETAFTVTPHVPGSSSGGRGLTLSTHAVERGSVSLATASPGAAVDKDGSLAVDRGALLERLANDEEGVEQSFRFDHAPEGRGDLRVHLRVSGMPYTGRTELGLHFADLESGYGIRYGRATWVDASGRRTDLETTYEGGEIVLRVPEALVEDSAYPAVLDPVLGPEIGTDNPVYLEGVYIKTYPAIASNGTDYLVVWSDNRNAAAAYNLYGARITDAGVMLDPAGLAIATGVASEYLPAIAFDGVNYLVVWQDTRNSATSKDDIYGARVTQAGAVLDPTGFPISTAGLEQRRPALAFNGTTYLVVWEDLRAAGPADIYGARVTTDGVTLDPGGLVLSNAPTDQLRPRLASDGSSFLVVWTDKRPIGGNASSVSVFGTRVGSDGTVLDPNGLAIAPYANATRSAPDVAFGGTSYLVAWAETCKIRGQRFDPVTAQPIDASPFNVAPCVHDHDDTAIAYGNGYFFVASQTDPLNTPYITGNWVNASTGVATPPGSSPTVSDVGPSYRYPAVASNGTSFLVAWSRPGGIFGPIHAKRLTVPNIVFNAPVISVSTVANAQTFPAVHHDGTRWLVAWEDTRANHNLYAVRIDAQGTVLDPAGIAVTADAANHRELAIAHDAQNFFLVWDDNRAGAANYDIYGARVAGASGALLDPNGIPISTASQSQVTPGVAFDGTNYFVVWEDDRTDSGGDIYGARVSAASGTTLDPAGISITKLAADEDNPSIAFDGTGYVVVWATGDIRGARVTTSGVVVDAAGFLVNGSAGFQGAPSIAYGAPNYFVTWSDLRSGVANIYGARVTPVGGILDPTGIAIATGANTLATSAVAFDGFNFPTAFADTTAGLAYLSWIRPDGVVLGPPGFAVLPPGQKLSGAPAVASDGAGNTMVGYARGSYAPPFGSIRVWSRLAHFGSSLGSACQAAADCGSGFCVDGVCCNTLCGNGVPNDCQVCSVAAGAAVDGTCSPVPQGPVCRPSAGVCDLTEVCDGVQLACPPNGFVPAGTECGASTGPCDPAEACTGQFPLCPANVMLPDGAACNDADACTMADHCMGGACAGAPVTCANTDQCHPSGACNAQTGQCVYPALPDATPCDDGDACTQMDACQNGSCTGGTPVVCPPPDQCHLAGACNAQTGLCSNPAKPSLSPCDDGDACTTGDVCKNGACVAGAPVVCPSATQCHDAGTCDPQTGACSAETKKPDGAGCTDGNLCTLDDSCQGGVCVAGAPLECPALDDCHEAGNCSKTTGQCSKPKKPNGSPCPGGTCQTGKCVPDGTGAGGSGGDGNTGGSGTTTASGAGGFATTGTSGTTATTGTGADASNDSGGGCGCGVVGSPVGGASWAAIGLLALLRRRKKRPALE